MILCLQNVSKDHQCDFIIQNRLFIRSDYEFWYLMKHLVVYLYEVRVACKHVTYYTYAFSKSICTCIFVYSGAITHKHEADIDDDKDMIQTAVNSGNVEITEYLLSTSNLTIKYHEDFLKKLVISAIYSESFSVLKCIVDTYPELLQCEYQIAYQDGKIDSYSLLHHAAFVGSKEIMEFLVQSGLDVKQRTSEREHTVLGFAAGSAHTDVVDYILNNNSSEDILSLGADPIVMAGAGGSVEIFNTLVNVGFDPMDKSKYGQTILHVALRAGNEDFAFYIMKQYPALIHMTGQYGRSALHFAAEGGSVTLLRHLIDNVKNARCVDEDGFTILHIACLADKRMQ